MKKTGSTEDGAINYWECAHGHNTVAHYMTELTTCEQCASLDEPQGVKMKDQKEETKFQVGDIVSVRGEFVGYERKDKFIRVHTSDGDLAFGRETVTLISRPKKKEKIQLYGWKYPGNNFPVFGSNALVHPNSAPSFPDSDWTRVPGADYLWDTEQCEHKNTKIWEPHMAGTRKCLDCDKVNNPNVPGWRLEVDGG